MFSLPNPPSSSSLLSAYTTFAAASMLLRTMLREVQTVIIHLIPKPLRERILSKFHGLMGSISCQLTVVIDEYNGLSLNEMFEACETYLRTKISPTVARLKVSKAPGEKSFSVTTSEGEKIIDTSEGIELVWQVKCTETQKTGTDCERGGRFTTKKGGRRSIELSFHKKDKDRVLSSYLPHVLKRSNDIKKENKVLKLHSWSGSWSAVNLDHPSTFDTLAMDPKLKEELIEDLKRFVERREFYRRVGKAWKRGYLLYGPPGTGKSSLIAAMANYLKFDVYFMELTSVRHDSDLRRALLSTSNRSIIVIEDIDCSSDFQNRQEAGHKQNGKQLTLSGLLNFVDGLWSSCGDERIFIFTTNHKDRLDPALLRPGRMDMHIHMSYCTPDGFNTLASNYLGIDSHFMFPEIEKLITEVEATPAEIAEELMKSERADIALPGLVEFLQNRKIGRDEANAEGEKKVTKSQEAKVEAEGKIEKNKRKARKRRNCLNIFKGLGLKL